MHPGRKTKVQNLGTGPLNASINVNGNIVDWVTDFTSAPISSQNRLPRILQTIHNAADRPGSFSNERPQSYIVSGAFTWMLKLRFYQCCVSTLGKVNMSTRLWYLDHSIGWRKYIRFWDQGHSAVWRKYILLWDLNHSAVWRKYIRLWDLDHSTGWRRATRGISREMSAKNQGPDVAWLCKQRGNENKNSTYLTKWNNSEAACLPLLQIARLRREVPADQALY